MSNYLDVFDERVYPHLCWIERLGGPNTVDGAKYAKENKVELEEEFNALMKENEIREEFGGSEGIHKINV